MFKIPEPANGHTLVLAIMYPVPPCSNGLTPHLLVDILDHAQHVLVFSDDGSSSAPDFLQAWYRHDADPHLPLLWAENLKENISAARVPIEGEGDDLQICLQRRYLDVFESRAKQVLEWRVRRYPCTLGQLEQPMSCILSWRKEGADKFYRVAKWSVRHKVSVEFDFHGELNIHDQDKRLRLAR